MWAYSGSSAEQTTFQDGLPEPAREVELLLLRSFCGCLLLGLRLLQFREDMLENGRNSLRTVARHESDSSDDVPRVADDSLGAADIAQRVQGLEAVEELCGYDRGHLLVDPAIDVVVPG